MSRSLREELLSDVQKDGNTVDESKPSNCLPKFVSENTILTAGKLDAAKLFQTIPPMISS